MLLYPTLNRSLLVSSNDWSPMLEEKRKKLSSINIFYQYEIDEGLIIPGSEKLIYGMTELSRNGVTSQLSLPPGKEKEIYPIEYNSVKGYLSSGLIWRNRFLFSKIKLKEASNLSDEGFTLNRYAPLLAPREVKTGTGLQPNESAIVNNCNLTLDKKSLDSRTTGV
jgi:hypothetical protein